MKNGIRIISDTSHPEEIDVEKHVKEYANMKAVCAFLAKKGIKVDPKTINLLIDFGKYLKDHPEVLSKTNL